MNNIILGAGRVGESVAESLVYEQNDTTINNIGANLSCCRCWFYSAHISGANKSGIFRTESP